MLELKRKLLMKSSTKKTNLSDIGLDLPSVENFKFGIVVSEWNNNITNSLLNGALETLYKCKSKENNIDVIFVPGSFELPQAAELLARKNIYDAIICIGCVIQGETRHFEFISTAVANGIMEVSLKNGIPVVFGVLTTNNIEQALDRSGGKHGNKGVEAAATAIKMVTNEKII